MMEYQLNALDNKALHERKHSGPGITSFILSLTAIIGYFTSFFLIATIMTSFMDQSPDAIIENLEQHSAIIGGGLLFIISGILNLIALILGIIGLAIKNRKKVFAILGTVFSVISFVGIILLFFLASISL
ncbi:hypothetical protein D3C76_705950 [compost metagenome]